MTDTRTPYTTNAPQPQRLTVTLTLDIADAAIAQYLAEHINANPLTLERGADPLALDYATLDFLLEAVQPRHPRAQRSALVSDGGGVDAFEADYQGRAWLLNFRLGATVGRWTEAEW